MSSADDVVNAEIILKEAVASAKSYTLGDKMVTDYSMHEKIEALRELAKMDVVKNPLAAVKRYPTRMNPMQ